jgi:3',5'-cyclic AMP phosphodiesterase CpdA
MPDRLILRFSDYEIRTIGAHLEIIAARDHVWWGWWKKEHEAFPEEVIQQSSATLPTDIGLINRKSHEYYIASCSAIEVGTGGERIPTPEPEATPPYYNTSRHPIWFRFDSIKPVTPEQWIDRFVGVPEGDPTLFWIERDERTSLIFPRLEIADEVDTPGNTILHISDLHFGEDHAFSTAPDIGGVHNPTMVAQICHRVAELGVSVGVLIVSGDVITKAAETSYSTDAQPMLELMLQRLGLEKNHMVMVPGNHDVPLATEEASPTPTREYRHELRFRDFLRSFFAEDIREIESLKRFRTAEGWRLSFVGLNSARLRDPDTKEYGYVGHRAEPWLRRIREANSDRSVHDLAQQQMLNVVVLHHHLLPGELLCRPERDRPVSLTLDAGQMVANCQDAGVHLVLHGHQHIPFLGSTSRARRANGGWEGHGDSLFVIGSGSSGASSARLPDEMRENTFGLYTPSDQGLRVDVEEFNPSLTGRHYMQLTIPL